MDLPFADHVLFMDSVDAVIEAVEAMVNALTMARHRAAEGLEAAA